MIDVGVGFRQVVSGCTFIHSTVLHTFRALVLVLIVAAIASPGIALSPSRKRFTSISLV